MMASSLQSSLAELTDIQRQAVEWDGGALLVLAGPGSGKTRVLTCRIARLLDTSPEQRFRILALTFTNKAAHEMETRVTHLAPGLERRVNIDTFHGFCAQILRQHGAHLGIRSDFAIYSHTEDRQAVLEDALRHGSTQVAAHEDLRLLPTIDCLKARLVGPEQAERVILARNGATSEDARRVAGAYRLYEKELWRANALDFNSLIFEAYKLFAYPAMVRHYQTVHRYWLIDEFQDINGAQYALLRRMAGDSFREVFAVADDDQTIYEWNGANVRRIREMIRDFRCRLVQLPTNFRCPPRIVEAANRLVVYNASRPQGKKLATAARTGSFLLDEEQVQCREFATDEEELAGIAGEIKRLDAGARDGIAVLARNRALLEAMHKALTTAGVPAAVLTRRDDFVSPQMRWFVACLKQIHRPLDRRNMVALIEAFGSFAESPLDWDELASRSASEEVPYLSIWTDALREPPQPVSDVVGAVAALYTGRIKLRAAVQQILGCLERNDSDDDLKDDLSAWRRIEREIRNANGHASLDRFLQELELRSKEPVPPPGGVSLATIHGAKGLEFDTVYLIGMAEDILPSWHSVKKGDGSAAMEEERRGCFVAVTRTKRRLILSRARRYRGWHKEPSRFLKEMGCPGATVFGDDERAAGWPT